MEQKSVLLSTLISLHNQTKAHLRFVWVGKKKKLRELKEQVGERAEQLEQTNTKRCQILYNLNLRGHFGFKFEKYWLYAQGT